MDPIKCKFENNRSGIARPSAINNTPNNKSAKAKKKKTRADSLASIESPEKTSNLKYKEDTNQKADKDEFSIS